MSSACAGRNSLSFNLRSTPQVDNLCFRLATDTNVQQRVISFTCGLPGYLILFDPRTFVPRVNDEFVRCLDRFLCNIYAFHRYITHSSTAFDPSKPVNGTYMLRYTFTADLIFCLAPFKPINPG